MVEEKKEDNQLRQAVALRYHPAKNQAPRVAAGGRGWLAERIVALARENQVPVVEDKALVKVLAALPLGEEVPAELYEAIAAVYAFIMEADRRQQK